jgi:hypothetical protein
VIGAVEDVEKPELNETPYRLMPPRVEWHLARVALEFVGADDAARREKAQRRDDADAKAIERHADGEMGTVRVDRIGEQDVEDALLPEDRRRVGERRTVDVRKRLFVGDE